MSADKLDQVIRHHRQQLDARATAAAEKAVNERLHQQRVDAVLTEWDGVTYPALAKAIEEINARGSDVGLHLTLIAQVEPYRTTRSLPSYYLNLKTKITETSYQMRIHVRANEAVSFSITNPSGDTPAMFEWGISSLTEDKFTEILVDFVARPFS